MGTPVIYLDTNILRDAMGRRNSTSVYWLRQIREKNWKRMTSIFGLMEVLDNEQDQLFVGKRLGKKEDFSEIFRERYRRDLESSDFQSAQESVNNFLTDYPNIEAVTLTEMGWKLALHIAANSNLFAPDAIHLASAWENSADILLTSDTHFIDEGRRLLSHEKADKKLKICNPEQMSKTLKSIGVSV